VWSPPRRPRRPPLAEYVTQVNQACIDTRPEFEPVTRQIKKLVKKTRQGKLDLRRFFNRLTKLEARITRIFAEMVERLALVSAAPGDETAVATWINGLRQYTVFQWQSIRATQHRKEVRASQLDDQAHLALNAGGAAVRDFGITACPLSIEDGRETFI